MTELALPQPAPNLIHKAAADLADAHRIAEVLVKTSFAPAHFRNKPEEGAVAILYGAGIGMDPMAAIQNIYVISGKPALYARSMVAIAMSHGHRIWTEESGPTKVAVCGQRKGSENVERSEWTIDRARKAGYLSNKKYEQEPEAMLYARASGDIARRIAPDALLGMAHSVEELEVAPQEPIVTPSTRTDRLRAAIAPAEPASATGNAAAAQPVKATAEPMLTDAQSKKLHALLREAGITDREVGLAYIGDVIGREVGSSKELTKAEASKAIEQIEKEKEPAESTLPEGAGPVPVWGES